MHDRLPPKGMHSESCDLFKFLEIRDNISLTTHNYLTPKHGMYLYAAMKHSVYSYTSANFFD